MTQLSQENTGVRRHVSSKNKKCNIEIYLIWMSFCDISIVYPWQDGRTNNPSLPVVYIPHDHHHPSNTWHILASVKIIASYSFPAPLPRHLTLDCGKSLPPLALRPHFKYYFYFFTRDPIKFLNFITKIASKEEQKRKLWINFISSLKKMQII